MVEFNYLGENIKINSIYETDHIYNSINKSKCFYEIGLLKTIMNMGLGGIYLDVGANIGNHTIFFSKFCKSNKVFSFEIFDEFCDIINENVRINNINNVVINRFGLGDKDGYVGLSSIDKNNVGMLSINDDFGNHKIMRLDSIIFNDKVSVIKIDVEGYETKVIQGGLNTIKEHEPIIITECRYEHEYNEQHKVLSSIGYYTNKINHAKTPTYIWRMKK